jgi:hypothetical protein
MELVKKNMVSIVCGVVAVIAVGAVFWPISGYYDELRGHVEQRKQVHDEFRNILNKERKMPVFTADSAEGVRLEGFPTAATIEKAKAVVDKFNSQAQGMYDRAVKLNEHKVLVPGAMTDSPSAWANFTREYKFKLEMPNPQNPVPQPLAEHTIARQIMKAGFAPTDQEIQVAREKKIQAINAQGVPGPGGGGNMNQAQLDAMMQEQLPKVADELKLKAAENCLVYLEPTAMDPSVLLTQPGGGGMPGMPGGIGPSVIFNAQIGLWIYEDAAKAIAAANKAVDAKDVRQSVVKHFVKIDVVDEPFKPMMPGAAMAPETAPPAPNSDPTAPLAPNYDFSPTGRIRNGLYDVVPFDLRIVVDATQIPRVMLELSRGRFITVTNVSMATVDSALKRSEGYYYGDNPVVELQLRCEALFMRKWTEPLMPVAIKQGLGLAAAPAQPGTPQ